jgi:hypothetical protein
MSEQYNWSQENSPPQLASSPSTAKIFSGRRHNSKKFMPISLPLSKWEESRARDVGGGGRQLLFNKNYKRSCRKYNTKVTKYIDKRYYCIKVMRNWNRSCASRPLQLLLPISINNLGWNQTQQNTFLDFFLSYRVNWVEILGIPYSVVFIISTDIAVS